MKPILLIFFLCFQLLSANRADAQYITIPDSNFVNWLRNNGYSVCMSGNLLDTTCTVLNTTYSVNCSNKGIHNLSGISAFRSLTYLDCRKNKLTTLPALPTNLEILLAEDNYLTGLPVLPLNLRELFVQVNQLTSLPTLTNNLEILHCGFNNISMLPTLPLNLKRLYCGTNNLTYLPAIPNGLLTLSCGQNNLTVLPPLPNSLTSLHVVSVPIDDNNWPDLTNCNLDTLVFSRAYNTTLGPLPSTLKYLDCGGYYLDSLVPFQSLPTGLETFICTMSNLNTLPVLPQGLKNLNFSLNTLNILPPLPDSLETFSCINCGLAEIPALPANLKHLWIDRNNLDSLPALPLGLLVLHCSKNPLTSLPQLPLNLYTLNCSSALLTSLPDFHNGFLSLNISDNPGISCLPPVSEIFVLRWSNTGITCLPGHIDISIGYPSVANLPICDFVNQGNCEIDWNIKGNLYSDSNLNCLLDSTEILHPQIKVNIFNGNNIYKQNITSQIGEYSFTLPDGFYTLGIDTTAKPFTVVCPSGNLYSDSVSPSQLLHDNRDFAIECKTGFDNGFSSIVCTSGMFRPANEAVVFLNAGDLSREYGLNCSSGISGTIRLIINGSASFGGIINGALLPVVTGDTLIYNIPDFGVLDPALDLTFKVTVDTLAQMNDQVCFDVDVLPITNDNNISNNAGQFCFTIVNSYDPNIKEVYPVGLIDTTASWLTYTVHFQNTGNAPAQNVFIRDTIDANIELGSFELLTSSHDLSVNIWKNVVVFNFPGINLPDSTSNEPASHGYVQYKVKRNFGLPIGTQIHNTAYIYFDFNAPVVTNTTTNEITTTVGLSNPVKSTFSVYPNPAGSGQLLSIRLNEIPLGSGKLNIYEIGGRTLVSYPVTGTQKQNQFTLPDLAPGIYLCELIMGGQRFQQKLVINH